MPHVDGLEATRWLRRALPSEDQPCVVAITANAQQRDSEQCLAAGMDGFLTKPVHIEVLTEAIHRVLPRPGPSERSPSRDEGPSFR